MTDFRMRFALLLTLASVTFLAAVAQADEGGLKKELTALLDEGWSAKDDGLPAIEAHRTAGAAALPGDVRTDYAWLLVQVRGHQYREAGETAAALVKSHPDHLPAQQIQIWLHALHKENLQALTEMAALAAQLAKVDAKHGASDVQKAAAKFLGQMFGYLAGPAAAKVTDPSLADREKAAVKILASELRGAFDAGRREADARFKQYQATLPVADPAADAKLADMKSKFVSDETAMKKSIAELRGKLESAGKQAGEVKQKIAAAETAEKKLQTEMKGKNNAAKTAALKKEMQAKHDEITKDQKELQKHEAEISKIKIEGTQQQKDLSHLMVQYKADTAKITGKPAATSGSAATDDGKSTTDLKSLFGYVPLDLDGQKQRLLSTFSGS